MLFNQKIYTIEPTKLLERYTVDTLTFTNSISHDFTKAKRSAIPQIKDGPRPTPEEYNEIGIFKPIENAYQTPNSTGDALGIKALCFFNRRNKGDSDDKLEAWFTTIKIITPSGSEKTIITENTSNSGETLSTIALDEIGDWQVIYTYDHVSEMTPTAIYTISVVRDIKKKPDYTITQVIERVLNAGLGNWNGYFELDPAMANRFKNIKAPEFHFTRKTLFEVLNTIGGYKDIQGIPRLVWRDEEEEKTAAPESLNTQSTWFGGIVPYKYYYEELPIYRYTFLLTVLGGAIGTRVTCYKVKNGSRESVYSSGEYRTNDGAVLETVDVDQSADYYEIVYRHISGIGIVERELTYKIYPSGKAREPGFWRITYDLLGDKTEWTPPGATEENPLGEFIAYHIEENINEYAGGFDTYAENLIDKRASGAIVQPYPQTVRTDSGELIVSDNYAIIKTTDKIYSVQSLEMWAMNANGQRIGDITPYVYEASEYKNLTRYKGEYPLAKQYAFYFTQGQPNLYGLVLKPETANILGIGDAVEQFAAVAVAERASGQTYGKGGIANFAYSITYTPITGARLKQYRIYKDRPSNNLLYYNQSANTLEAELFGGDLKARLARTGNPLEIVTYRLYDLKKLPRAGEKIGDKYICKIDWEKEQRWIRCTLWLTKDYNKLNQYVALDSQERYYEVSEKMSVLRQCNFSYELCLSRTPDGGGENLLRSWGRNMFLPEQLVTSVLKAAFAVVQPLAEDGTKIGGRLLMPVRTTAAGNSAAFTITFEDNYSAGPQLLYLESAKKLQRAVPYGDEYGEFHSLQIDIYGAGSPFLKNGSPVNFTYADQISSESKSGFCDALPQLSDEWSVDDSEFEMYRLLSWNGVIQKDGREQIEVTLQLHFRAEDTGSGAKDIIVGTAFASELEFMTGEAIKKYLVMLPYKLGALEERLYGDWDGYISSQDIAVEAYPDGAEWMSVQAIKFTPENGAAGDAEAWAVVDADGRILFGANEAIKKGEKGSPIYLNLGAKKL